MATQTLKINVDEFTTIMVQISHSDMSTEEFRSLLLCQN